MTNYETVGASTFIFTYQLNKYYPGIVDPVFKTVV